jgi:hypothetical protein
MVVKIFSRSRWLTLAMCAYHRKKIFFIRQLGYCILVKAHKFGTQALFFCFSRKAGSYFF